MCMNQQSGIHFVNMQNMELDALTLVTENVDAFIFALARRVP